MRFRYAANGMSQIPSESASGAFSFAWIGAGDRSLAPTFQPVFLAENFRQSCWQWVGLLINWLGRFTTTSSFHQENENLSAAANLFRSKGSVTPNLLLCN